MGRRLSDEAKAEPSLELPERAVQRDPDRRRGLAGHPRDVLVPQPGDARRVVAGIATSWITTA